MFKLGDFLFAKINTINIEKIANKHSHFFKQFVYLRYSSILHVSVVRSIAKIWNAAGKLHKGAAKNEINTGLLILCTNITHSL